MGGKAKEMRILMVMAHPDDEVIFGWPIIQEREHDVTLLTLSHNRERHGVGPIPALEEVCNLNQIHLVPAKRLENNFYRLPPRFEENTLPKAIEHLRRCIQVAVDVYRPEYIFTHNPWGEYGHGDHRYTFSLVVGFDIPLLMTDICTPNVCHLSYKKKPTFWDHYFKSAEQIVPEELNLVWYNEMKDIYMRHKAWSWSGHCPVTSCCLYRFD